ncbi:MAG: hypothetical protein C4526_08910 [Nitrospiraceae bacterium]|nr:MAG: hypothetical protein C4526_08910 [Nitrospiraceae bacterium]
MEDNMKGFKILILLLMTTSISCGSLTDSRSFIHPDADFSFYQKVGLLPFKTQADDRLAGEKVTEHFLTELLIRGELEVMDPGQFNAVAAQVAGVNVPASMLELTPEQIGKIADVADIQGIFSGTIHDYKMVQLGGEQYPMISMTVKFIDALTGKVVWQNSVTATGGPNLPIVSIGEEFTLGQLSQKISQGVVKDFYKKAYPK